MAESIKTILGRNIKNYRLKSGLSQSQLAEIVDVSFRYISYVECGKSFPSAEVLDAIAKALRVPVHTLFCQSPSSLNSESMADIKSALIEAAEEIKTAIDNFKAKIECL